MKIIRKGYGSYKNCWIEQRGVYYYVCILDGQSERGPYSTLKDALEEFSRYVA